MPTNNKYTIRTDMSKSFGNYTLYRVQSLRQIRPLSYATNPYVGLVIPSGSIGGWIQKQYNLSIQDECWVGEQAMVFGNARVKQSSYVGGNACIYGAANIRGHSNIRDHAQIFGNAQIGDYDDGFINWSYGIINPSNLGLGTGYQSTYGYGYLPLNDQFVYAQRQSYDDSLVGAPQGFIRSIYRRIRPISTVSFIKQYIYPPWLYDINITESISKSYYEMYMESENNIFTHSVDDNMVYRVQFITSSVFIKNEYFNQQHIPHYTQALYRNVNISGRAWVYGTSIIVGGASLFDDADINNSLVDGYFSIGGNTKFNYVTAYSNRPKWNKSSDIYAYQNTAYVLDDVNIQNSYLNLSTIPHASSRLLHVPLQYTAVLYSNATISNSGVSGSQIIDYNVNDNLLSYRQPFEFTALWENRYTITYMDNNGVYITKSNFTANKNSFMYALSQISQLMWQISSPYDPINNNESLISIYATTLKNAIPGARYLDGVMWLDSIRPGKNDPTQFGHLPLYIKDLIKQRMSAYQSVSIENTPTPYTIRFSSIKKQYWWQ